MFEKLFAMIQTRVKNWGVYRFDFFSVLIGNIIPLAGLSLYWVDRLQSSPQGMEGLFGISASKGIIVYYVIVYLVEMLFSYEIAFSVEEDISTGKLNGYLLLPCHYIVVKLAEYLFGCLFPVVLLLLAVLALKIGFLSVSIVPICFFLLLVAVGMLFHFLFFMTIALLTIWMKNIDGMIYFLQTFTSLLAGMVVPLFFLPDSLAWLKWNPFALSTSVPSMVLLTGEISMVSFFALLGWCLLMYGIFYLAWDKALRNYQAYGG